MVDIFGEKYLLFIGKKRVMRLSVVGIILYCIYYLIRGRRRRAGV